MKHMKRAAALFLALIMIMSLAVTAFAANPAGKITIQDSATVSVAKKTFNAYKVLDASLKDPTNVNAGVSYTVPEAMKNFYAERYQEKYAAVDGNSEKKLIDDTNFNALVSEYVSKELETASNRYTFAREALAAAKAANVTPKSATAGNSDTSVAITGLDLGYYVIQDAGAELPLSTVMMDNAEEGAGPTITLKADKPSMEKKIGDASSSAPSNTANIGDKVPFYITAKVPDMTGYTKYFFVVNDTLSKGLSYDHSKAGVGDKIVVKIGETPLTEDTHYTVTPGTTEAGETTLKIVFKDFIDHAANKGDTISISYKATVDDDAVIGKVGNSNKVTLTYSNNPNVAPQGTGDEPDPDKDKDIIGETPDSVTKTFVTGIAIDKVAPDGKPLAGAEFTLTAKEGSAINTVLVKTTKFEIDPTGTWYKLKDGTYTETKATEETQNKYESTEDLYKKAEQATVEKQTIVTGTYNGVTGGDGKLRFDGLKAGEYILTETKAPDGFNKLADPIEFKIECTLPDPVSGDCTWKVTPSDTFSVGADGVVTTRIENKAGSVLPETGGMGTTMFFVIGSMLVMASAVLLIADKRRKQF